MTALIRKPLGYAAWLCICTAACFIIFQALGVGGV